MSIAIASTSSVEVVGNISVILLHILILPLFVAYATYQTKSSYFVFECLTLIIYSMWCKFNKLNGKKVYLVGS